MMEDATPDKQLKIRELLEELSAKMKVGARVQAIGDCPLQVAAPLYLIFAAIIQVM